MSSELWLLLARKKERQRQIETIRQQDLGQDLSRIRERREYIDSVIDDCSSQKRGMALSGGQFSDRSSYLRQVLAMKHELLLEEERIRAAIAACDASVRAHAREERKFEKLEQLAHAKQQRQADKQQSRETDEINIALFNRGGRP
jgi:DNA primase large subunit